MKNAFSFAIQLFLVCICTFVRAQSVYRIEETKDINMMLAGTSTLHKWSMDVKTFEGEAQFVFSSTDDSHLSELKSLTFSLDVVDLKSESKALDKNAYKALKSDKFKDIHYKLRKAGVSHVKENIYLLVTEGNLTIAGVTKEIVMEINCLINTDGTINCAGSHKLNMSDFNVKPPTFMMGAMKTGDAIELHFVLVYKKQKGI